MRSFVVSDAALAGLKVLSAVNRKDRRMFALERWVEVVFAVPLDRMRGSDRPAKGSSRAERQDFPCVAPLRRYQALAPLSRCQS